MKKRHQKPTKSEPKKLDILLVVNHEWNLHISMDKTKPEDKELANSYVTWLKKKRAALMI